MPHPTSDCDRWQEPVSLLAANCCPAEDEAGVRRHLAGCPACAARFAELSGLCQVLERSRPPAAVHAGRVRSRWHETSAEPRPSRPLRRPPPLRAWLAGAVALSLLAAAAWWIRPAAQPTPPQRSRSSPTLWAYETALASSDEAFDSLLRRHGESIVFERFDPRSLAKECLP